MTPSNQAYESFGPIRIDHKFKGFRETLHLPEIMIELTPERLTIVPVDEDGRRQVALAKTYERDKSS